MSKTEVQSSFAVRAAKASWVAPLMALVLSFVGKNLVKGEFGAQVAIVLLIGCLLLSVAGIAFSLVAFAGTVKHGFRGIVIPAMIGLVLSSGILYLFYISMDLAKRKKTSSQVSVHLVDAYTSKVRRATARCLGMQAFQGRRGVTSLCRGISC